MTFFSPFSAEIYPQDALRQCITKATRLPEPDCIQNLLKCTSLPDNTDKAITDLARSLSETMRHKKHNIGVESLVQEFSLSSHEGVALMCLAEALLRIPDEATRDALIRDKIAIGDWASHLGLKQPLFINVAAWGLMITGQILRPEQSSQRYTRIIKQLVKRVGEPVVRKAVYSVMKLMGEQFVVGQTIEEARKNSITMEAAGFRYSYDMLGEAAVTAQDALRYRADYEQAIHAIGLTTQGANVYERAGISIKLSALHPRYVRSQRDRVMKELLPVLVHLALLARRYDIGLNIDAEESERLELSLDLLEALCHEGGLKGWNGIGFVVQAYGKRAPYVLDWVIDLARRTNRRMMVRLVKGAYWDSEIKKAQVDGLTDFPVFTRKIHTDVSYLACARKLLDAKDNVFPQFATHNARTLATIYHMAGVDDYHMGQYEFQCLHGMGEGLYSSVVGANKLGRPCRIYAPVGTHETLLAYLVRRLLENGANSSFVHRLSDPSVRIDDLVANPVKETNLEKPIGSKHPGIKLPRHLYDNYINSRGVDLTDEVTLNRLAETLNNGPQTWRAVPILGSGDRNGPAVPLFNPADWSDQVGEVISAIDADVHQAMEISLQVFALWAGTLPSDRASMLEKAADIMEDRTEILLGLLVRESGKSWRNAVAEVREAVDFMRCYASQIRVGFDNKTHIPLGPVVCISPWNFPLSIFTGQMTAALAAGNTVVAKPAESTSLIAAQAVNILHESGIPPGVVQFLPGRGSVIGKAIINHPATAAVMFTGSTGVAQSLAQSLVNRRGPGGFIIPLVAETGGQNAMIVDSSALAEQVVVDVLDSAFDSAGQRCSALRVLCVQEDCADRLIAMLRGAMDELCQGNPVRLSTDIGPVIDQKARDSIIGHIHRMKEEGNPVYSLPLPDEAKQGFFISPTLIEIKDISDIQHEVFGPVLHVLRYQRGGVDKVIDKINATGYGLTFGLHTRIQTLVDHVTDRVSAGNIYVNRNTIGAVVGVQPFGGRGLSGTGPKAGGPLMLRRLLANCPVISIPSLSHGVLPEIAQLWLDWLASQCHPAYDTACKVTRHRLLNANMELSGPVGEVNRYELHSRGRVLCIGHTENTLIEQISVALSCGNPVAIFAPNDIVKWMQYLPAALSSEIQRIEDVGSVECSVLLGEKDCQLFMDVQQKLTETNGAIVLSWLREPEGYRPEVLLEEKTISVNTTASGGNASLMAIG